MIYIPNIRSVNKSDKVARASGVLVIFSTLIFAALIGLIGCDDADGDPSSLDTPADFTAVAGNAQVTLNWRGANDADEYRIYRAIGGNDPMLLAVSASTTYNDANLDNGTVYTYLIRAVNTIGESDDSAPASATPGIDSDGDGLIAISSLEQLNNVRNNLAGTAYNDGTTAVQCGAAADTDCRGYELTRSLDFNNPTSYAAGTVNSAWRPNDANPDNATNAGWATIRGSFTAIFDGNGNTISNLYIRGSGNVGFFANLADGSVISNLGMLAGKVYGTATNNENVGGLAGRQGDNSVIVASYSTGDVDGISGTSSDGDSIGGLVGSIQSDAGIIMASYSTGDVRGGDNGADEVGGIAGTKGGDRINPNNIINSYATGDIYGGASDSDSTGGLVGFHDVGNISVSYATGNIDGGEGVGDRVGGLVGLSDHNTNNRENYSFGMLMNGEHDGLSPRLSNGAGANDLTAANAGSEWRADVWDFGTASQPPALKYADYDQGGDDYHCADEAGAPPAGAILIVNCGELLPNQPGR